MFRIGPRKVKETQKVASILEMRPQKKIYTVCQEYPDSHRTMRVRILVEHSVHWKNIILEKYESIISIL